MIRLYSPLNETELSILRSILNGEGIKYHVLNDHFGTLKTGPKIDLINAKTIFVFKSDFELAKEILNNFLENTDSSIGQFKSQYSLRDKIRVVIETLIFGWFVPGKKWVEKELDEEI
jgi:hypothetical protein